MTDPISAGSSRLDVGKAARVAVILASAGRPDLLADVIDDLRRQTRQDFDLILSVPDDESLPSAGVPDHALVVHDRGLAAQRNAGLDAVPEATHVFFFDDDAVVREDYVEQGMAFFEAHAEVVALTGRVLLDGAAAEAVSRGTGEQVLKASYSQPLEGRWTPSRQLYGCNFAIRRDALGAERFDARLPLYSWLEDHDFARRAMRYGVLARVDDCVIVHRGVKSGGRMAHERLGYSQVMNPAYLARVGSFPLWLSLREILPRLLKNVVLAVGGSEARWRRQRLRGNLRALADVLRGHFTPERILEFD